MNKLFRTITDSQEENDVVQLHVVQDVEHKITIETLEIMMSIGILPEEKQNQQRVIIDLEAWLEPKANYNDDIANTVSYADIIKGIKNLTASHHFNLVETLASEISNLCLAYHQVVKTSVSIKKPDIIQNVQNVGFSMVKKK